MIRFGTEPHYTCSGILNLLIFTKIKTYAKTHFKTNFYYFQILSRQLQEVVL